MGEMHNCTCTMHTGQSAKLICALRVCFIPDSPVSAMTWEEKLTAWRAAKAAEVSAPYGWLSLVGLHYLAEGQTVTVGSKGVLALPRGPDTVGSLRFEGGKASLLLDQGETTELELDKPLIFESGLSLTLIRRFGKDLVRVRDPEVAKGFVGMKWFAPNAAWHIVGKWVAEEMRHNVGAANGEAEEQVFGGYVAFAVDGAQFRLYADVSDELFIVFKDQTSKTKESYGAGRFITAALPNENGEVVLDFNRAYNPACFWSNHAVCPMPIKQNHLFIRIEAGERT